MVEVKVTKDELKEAFKSENALHNFIYIELFNRVARAILNDNTEGRLTNDDQRTIQRN